MLPLPSGDAVTVHRDLDATVDEHTSAQTAKGFSQTGTVAR